ncbi:unnamed protein product [Scytosiphon promiscuus]
MSDFSAIRSSGNLSLALKKWKGNPDMDRSGTASFDGQRHWRCPLAQHIVRCMHFVCGGINRRSPRSILCGSTWQTQFGPSVTEPGGGKLETVEPNFDFGV